MTNLRDLIGVTIRSIFTDDNEVRIEEFEPQGVEGEFRIYCGDPHVKLVKVENNVNIPEFGEKPLIREVHKTHSNQMDPPEGGHPFLWTIIKIVTNNGHLTLYFLHDNTHNDVIREPLMSYDDGLPF